VNNSGSSSNRHTGWLIAAAFIGPGTVTTASIAGAQFGFTVLWALMFSVFATLVLQEMAVRLGIVTRNGLAEAIHSQFQTPIVRWLASALIIGAIGIGNAAYEGGNLTGAALGLSQITNLEISYWVLALALFAFTLLWFGSYKIIESVLLGLVAIMSLVFVLTAIVSEPNWALLFRDAISPRLDAQTLTVVLALIGTTVVPYNLFLHASIVSQYEGNTEAELDAQRRSSLMAICVGGLITLVILTTASAAFYQSGQSLDAGNIASQLEPLLGPWASNVFAIGLFAAGLTSAITAPLAAGYAVCGALGIAADMRSKAFRIIWIIVLVSGALVASIGLKPLVAVLFAQATNGLLLPFIACFLILAMNSQSRLNEHRNKPWMTCSAVPLCYLPYFLDCENYTVCFNRLIACSR
jgi:NRAMP (natural resistance-associated macrophage protein)-like metal ion transporter